MSIQRQLRRATTSQINAVTPAEGEPLFDMTRKTIVVGDGSTTGGLPLLAYDASGNIGIGSPATYRLDIYKSSGDPAVGDTLQQLFYNLSITADNPYSFEMLRILPFVQVATGKTLGSVVGINGLAYTTSVNMKGTITDTIGVSAGVGFATATSGAHLVNVYAFQGTIYNQVAGTTITNAFGIKLATWQNAGTITNLWGVYQEDATAKNYFAGNTQIGTTINNGALTIGGNVMPEADNTRNLGSASFRFASTFVAQLVATAARITTAKTPATAGATGTQGDFCWDASYLYVCTAANTWRRAAHATW